MLGQVEECGRDRARRGEDNITQLVLINFFLEYVYVIVIFELFRVGSLWKNVHTGLYGINRDRHATI